MDRVDEMTDGKVGYLHIPDMGPDGIAEFIKWFYPQIRKEGLIVDVRGNGGGNVSAMIIERLGREVLGTRFGRTSEVPGTYPQRRLPRRTWRASSRETSASDGDIFPHYFREAGLGPLIGKRTWGGVVGGGNIGLIDGGAVFVPAVGDQRPRWRVHHRGHRCLTRHRDHQRSGVGARGRGPTARARRRRGPRGHGGGAQGPARAARRSGEDTGLKLSATDINNPAPEAHASGAVSESVSVADEAARENAFIGTCRVRNCADRASGSAPPARLRHRDATETRRSLFFRLGGRQQAHLRRGRRCHRRH